MISSSDTDDQLFFDTEKRIYVAPSTCVSLIEISATINLYYLVFTRTIDYMASLFTSKMDGVR